ncbi:phasin family protein [Xanthomonadaceae bacterium XH05]|nr:phasin family protein [Xanthomonadaceae bacterium XH05]
MVKQAKNPSVDPRDLWLAGLGMVSLSRKQAAKVYGTLVAEGTQFRDSANQRIDALSKQARANLGDVKAKVEAAVDPLLSRVNGVYGTVKGELESRLSPVVATFSKKKAKSARKPAARKPAAAKKAVKKVATKARGTAKKAA